MQKKIILLFTLLAIALASEAQSKRKRKIIISVVTEARTYRGTPYVYGGSSQSGIDCSGLIYNSFRKVGITLPRIAEEQSKIGKKKGWGSIRPGDLVYFKFKENGEKWYHSGMITDTTDPQNIIFIHASSSKGVIESTLNLEYYQKNVKKFRRVIQ